ncbi:SMI1/KNR4 family protein [Variovorax paradoxus]|uniref:Knr4/Smi1-like domain-containing protein n=1 Tax=Variovorax paradoxus TaxID=34073 RepID=A0A679IX55_VARPD|nr:hypothetical protein VVAX_02751 [Variovorax paradoxus]
MSTHNPSGALAPVLRIAMGLLLVLSMAAAGGLHRSAWTVVLAAPLFIVLYALGKWNSWVLAWRLGGAKRIVLSALVTLPIQAVVAGLFYLIGLGLAALLAPAAPIAELSGTDVRWALALFAVAVAASAAIIRLEAVTPHASPDAEPPVPEAEADADADADADRAAAAASVEEVELDLDPMPLRIDSFFVSPGYFRINAARQALSQLHGEAVAKPPFAASEAMLAEAEARLGFRLPVTLRQLYGVMNGGYVGWQYVPLKADAKPVDEDWRGAFSIDYSSLVPVGDLRTVAEHYDDFTHEPEDVPADADKLVVLQARYGDMTLLDYRRGPEAGVLIVDYGKQPGADPVDAAFDSFDEFFSTLRRERRSPGVAPSADSDLERPLGEAPEALRAPMFWGEARPHAFYLNAVQRKDGSEPALAADDALVARTEARLGVRLPPSLTDLWRAKNGGGVSCRFVDLESGEGLPRTYVEAVRYLVPMEHFTTLAELSDRIVFAPEETPWKAQFAEPHRLVVLDADHGRLVLLDHRGEGLPGSAGDAAVLVVEDLDRGPPREVLRFERFDDLLARLRAKRVDYEDVAKPWKPAAASTV